MKPYTLLSEMFLYGQFSQTLELQLSGGGLQQTQWK